MKTRLSAKYFRTAAAILFLAAGFCQAAQAEDTIYDVINREDTKAFSDMVMLGYDIDEQDIDMLQRDFITFKQGAEYYKMGMKPFIRICRESGGVYKIGKMVRVNRHILEPHIRKLRLKEEK